MNDLISFNDDDNNLAQQNKIISQQNTPFQELNLQDRNAFQGLQSLVERRKIIEQARKSRFLFGAVSALEKLWNPHPAP